MIVAIKGIGEWGEAQEVKAQRAAAEAQTWQTINEVMENLDSNVNNGEWAPAITSHGEVGEVCLKLRESEDAIKLCEKAEELSNLSITNHKEWDIKSGEIIELQRIWKTIGFAPKKDNNRIYLRFRESCDKFFNKKREFYSLNREEQNNNLQRKTDLCVQAEALQDSNEWKKTTEELITLQKSWKEIGPVPYKHSEKIWRRFRAACDKFFEKKETHFSEVDNSYENNLKKKQELIEKVIKYDITDNIEECLKKLKEFQREWAEIGFVPYKYKDEIQEKYRTIINEKFDSLNVDENYKNVFYVGSSTVPGTGVPMAVISSKLVTERILQNGHL